MDSLLQQGPVTSLPLPCPVRPTGTIRMPAFHLFLPCAPATTCGWRKPYKDTNRSNFKSVTLETSWTHCAGRSSYYLPNLSVHHWSPLFPPPASHTPHSLLTCPWENKSNQTGTLLSLQPQIYSSQSCLSFMTADGLSTFKCLLQWVLPPLTFSKILRLPFPTPCIVCLSSIIMRTCCIFFLLERPLPWPQYHRPTTSHFSAPLYRKTSQKSSQHLPSSPGSTSIRSPTLHFQRVYSYKILHGFLSANPVMTSLSSSCLYLSNIWHHRPFLPEIVFSLGFWDITLSLIFTGCCLGPLLNSLLCVISCWRPHTVLRPFSLDHLSKQCHFTCTKEKKFFFLYPLMFCLWSPAN